MIGPGRGHNIEPFLDCLQDQDRWAVTFLSLRSFAFDRRRYDRIDVAELVGPRSIVTLASVLRRPYDLIWDHGAYHTWLSLAVLLLRRRSTFLNLNIWSEKLPRSLATPGLASTINQWLLRSSGEVQCNWHGTQRILDAVAPEAKTVVSPWGLHDDFLAGPAEEVTPFVDDFLKSLPEGATKFFYPKSFSVASRHDLLLEAARGLVEEGRTDFVMYWWLGNIDDRAALERFRSEVADAGLEEQVRIVADKPFLPLGEYRTVWEAMDCGLQIAEMDQFSTTFIEPMLLEKPLIATAIEPYRIFEEVYGLDLGLVELDVAEIRAAMRRVMDGVRPRPEELALRRTIVERDFSFRANIIRRLSELEPT